MTEHKFVPKPGQVDYTNIRYAPAIKVIAVYDGKVLLTKRTEDRRFYPGYWDTINGFLDDHASIEEKAAEELNEEVGMATKDIDSVKRGQVVLEEDPEYRKTWLLVPVLAKVKTDRVKLDWEATDSGWFTLEEIGRLKTIPGTLEIIKQFSSEML